MLRYLLGAEEPDRRVVGRALAGLRIVAGLLRHFNVDWKRPPDFRREGERLLDGYVQAAIDHPEFPPFNWVIENVAQPGFISLLGPKDVRDRVQPAGVSLGGCARWFLPGPGLRQPRASS